MEDFVSFPETLDIAPFLAPDRGDYKVTHTPQGPHARYMAWEHPEKGPALTPCLYQLYGESRPNLGGRDSDMAAVVVHLGTIDGGHYIAYCLIDPEKMFERPPTPLASTTDLHSTVESLKVMSIYSEPQRQTGPDRRVWCFCSEWVAFSNIAQCD